MIIQTKGLTYSYGGNKVFTFPNIACMPGETVLVLGASGSGKTTLLHLIAGILRQAAGSIVINNTIVSSLSPATMDSFRGKHIGMIFQQHHFLKGLHVFENLIASQKLSGAGTDRRHLYALLEEMDISDLMHKKPESLSQGELQRFSIARALANKPLIVFADEPTSSLDDHHCAQFVKLIKQASVRHHTAWVIATHDQRLKDQFDQTYTL